MAAIAAEEAPMTNETLGVSELGPFRLGSVEVEVRPPTGVRRHGCHSGGGGADDKRDAGRLRVGPLPVGERGGGGPRGRALLPRGSHEAGGRELAEPAPAEFQPLRRPELELGEAGGAGGGQPAAALLGDAALELPVQQFTHMTPHGRAAVPLASRCNGAGLMALTETSDGALLFGLRSRRAGALPLHWHCMPAGVVDAPDPAAVLRKELVEETGFEWPAVTACEFLAIMLTGEEQGDKPEFVFRLVLAASARDIYGRRRAAEDSAEHEALAFVRIPGRDGPQPWAVEGGEAAPKDLFFADLDGFVEGKLGPLTDVSKRALALLRALGVPP
eukprot:CAMPEP_0175419016 /NCGR_PEP_ID=MMETSP0095-20121207/46011_1 /TAXON_ID=311494 /ORGANISM="Alexandrium monilatum, Strain CCMP3105" /LENGTH=330 /DNA_ID=CAMNT_0016718193 /DNA_START=51 /DNA_END=1040 /DNA_ORIENTATION=-